MLTIGHEYGNKLEYKGAEYTLNLEFRRVLKAFEMIASSYPDELKIAVVYDLLVGGKCKPNDMAAIVAKVFETYINILPKQKDDEPKSMDFQQDFKYIYSSFKKDYDIDLLDESLQWQRFITLFIGLSRGTKINEVIYVRKAKMPKETKYNQEEIENLAKAKQYYALDISKEERSAQFANSLKKFAQGVISKGR